MTVFPQALNAKLERRKADFALRGLTTSRALIDFSSNDYLGLSQSKEIFERTHKFLSERQIFANGATGSRLLSGNHPLFDEAETIIGQFHASESALIFNSGYDANVGFFSSVPQRDDVVLYDELSHASIRDGIKMGNAKAYKFAHNDTTELEQLIDKYSDAARNIYIATESVFSMDGDSPNLVALANLSEKYNCYLVVDEAHALGVFGNGLVNTLGIENKVFARIVTFGKGLGCHGAAILGPAKLKQYLINFSRSFIYTTALPPHSIATIISAYGYLSQNQHLQNTLQDNIAHFSQEKTRLGLKQVFVRSKAAVQSAIIPGNDRVRDIGAKLQSEGYDVRPILSPTVPEGQERLRFCIHSFNSREQISDVLRLLADALF